MGNKFKKDWKKLGYENMAAWQKGMLLIKEIYSITSKFPKSETFGLSS